MNGIPPRSEELEQAVLGAILLNPERLLDGSISVFTPEIFYKTAHRTIAEAMAILADQDIAPDTPNLVNIMTETGNLQKVGGAYAITGLPALASIDPQGDLSRLQVLAVKRQMREAAIKYADLDFEYHTAAEIREQRDLLLHPPNEDLASQIGVINQPMTVQEMAADQSPLPEAIIKGLLLRETTMMIYGEPGTGKTLMSLDIAMALAEGRSWHNLQITDSHKVLVMVAEGGYYSIRERVKILLGSSNQMPENRMLVWPVKPFDILEPSHFSEITRVIEMHQPDVIMMDPLRKLHRADENDNGKMEFVMTRLRSLITGKNRSLILVHHAGKTNYSPRGASAIIGDCDSILKLEWNRNDDTLGTRTLRCEKVRHDEMLPDLVLNLNPSTLKFITSDPHGRDRVVNILKNMRGKIDSKKKLVDQLTAMKVMEKSNAYALIKKAEKSNLIRQEDDGSILLCIPDSILPTDSKSSVGTT